MGSQPFAGLAGQVIGELLTVRGGLRSLPFVILLLLLGAAGLVATSLAVPMPPTMQALAVLVFASPVMAHDALRARFCERPAPVEVMALSGRLSLLIIVWGAPLAAVAQLYGPLDLAAAGILSAPAWPDAIAATLAAGYLLIGLLITLTLTTVADGLVDLLRPSLWAWLVREVGRELPAAMATLIGGVACCYLIGLPVVLLVASGLVRLHPYAGVIGAGLGLVSPIAVGALIAARLGGTLASLRDRPAAALEPELAREKVALSATARAEAPISAAMLIHDRSPALAPAGAGLTAAMEFIQRIQSLQHMAEEDLDAAIREGEVLFDSHPKSAGVLAELAKLYRRAGRDVEAVEACGRAVRLALHGGMSPVAVEIFHSFVAHRDQLGLEADDLTALSKVLRVQGHTEQADWCEARAGQLVSD